MVKNTLEYFLHKALIINTLAHKQISTSINKISLAVVALAIIAYYFFINPAQTNLGFQCLFYRITGFYCMGCGGQRAFHALLHGHFREAFNLNLLVFFVIPLLGMKFYEEIFAQKIMPKIIYSRPFLIVLAVFVFIFTVYRNF